MKTLYKFTLSLLIAFHIPGALAAITFGLVESGTANTTLSVGASGAFNLDVITSNYATEPGVQPNLDAFTYLIEFPNQGFTLTSNVFQAPFDNTLAPSGFNGSVPFSSLPVVIDNTVDGGFGDPATADIYRTTTTLTGTPVIGPTDVIETLGLLAPDTLGSYQIDLNILEAVDGFGEFHTVTTTGLNITVVPLPPSIVLLAFSLGLLTLPGFSRKILFRS